MRSVELRDDGEGLSGAYFKYWIGAMEGRFVPGRDLSFPWEEEATTKDAIRERMARRGAGAFLYFHAPEDAQNKHAKALQTVTFFKLAVRRAARRLVPVKLDRHAHEALFEGFGVKTTPAVVVLDGRLGVVKILTGSIKAAALAKAFKKAGK